VVNALLSLTSTHHLLLLLLNCLSDLVEVNLRHLRVLLCLDSSLSDFLDFLIRLVNKLQHRLLLQCDRLLQTFEKLSVF